MLNRIHEIRDPIHVFVRLDSNERRVLDSSPVQRLRNIHQLAMSYLVYPGATHSRFEHALGVMELSSRVFDIVTQQDIQPSISNLIPTGDTLSYWRRVLRMAALLHDIGHLPFSHAGEKDLLPEGWSHEHITVEFIRNEEMRNIWENEVRPILNTEDIVKLAVGPKELPDVHFTVWEALLSEIVVGNAFGVDRMDYLLRDSHHTGVAYGKFDQYRLIDTLRILPKPQEAEDSDPGEPMLGLARGGIHSAEALLLARYFMFKQVYLHPIRRIYDRHLIDFLKEWLPTGRFPTEPDSIIKYSDVEVMTAMQEASLDSGKPGHEPARRIIKRQHFKLVYSRNPDDRRLHPDPGAAIQKALVHPDPGAAIQKALEGKYGKDRVRRDEYSRSGGVLDFPVLDNDNRVVSAFAISDTLNDIPPTGVDYVFIDSEYRNEAKRWIEQNRVDILSEPDSEGE